MKTAILQMADTQSIEAITVVLKSAGYTTKLCRVSLRKELERIGCDTVIAHEAMLQWGYPELLCPIEEASPAEMDDCDLYVDIKYRNLERVWERWPRLKELSFWRRVNGGRPCNTAHGGEEIDTQCPVVTSNLWYNRPEYNKGNRNYAFWPPHPRSFHYQPLWRDSISPGFEPPYCLCHNVRMNGFGELVERCRDFGLRTYGIHSPDDVIHHDDVPRLIGSSLACVHLKSVDAPGWALYEALAGGCPLIVANVFVNRMLAYGLLEHDVTCLTFGPAGDEWGCGDQELDRCLREIEGHLKQLRDPEENRRIGMAGRERLQGLMWSERKNGAEFREFVSGQF